MGCFSTCFQGLPSCFLCTSRLSFFQPLASKSMYCILLPRLCLQKLSNREQIRGCSNSGLRCLGQLRVHVFTEFAYTDAWNYAKAPSSHRGAEGRCLRLLVAFSGGLQQTLSLGPCAVTVQRAPGHNRWGVSETILPAKTQGRTLDCPFNLIPPRVAGWLLMCRCQACNWAAVALVATGPRQVAL